MQREQTAMIGFSVLMFMLFMGCEKKNLPSFQCTDAIGCVDIGPEEPIKVGVLQVFSGEVKSLGIDQSRMAELVLLNRKGKLLGHPVELQPFDEMCSKEGGRTAAQQIVSDPRIVAVFGTTCSGAAAPAMKVISEAGYSMISGANTAQSLTSVNGQKGPDYHEGYFRVSHNDEVQGRAAATFAYQKLKINKAATIHDGDVYTKGLAQVFQRAFEALGGQVVIATAVNKGDTDMAPVLEAVAESGAKFVFLPLFRPEGDFIIKHARKLSMFKDIVLMGADGLLEKSFLESVADAGRGMYFVGPAKPDGADYKKIIQQYQKKYGERPLGPLHAQGYDALNVLMSAIERVAIQDDDQGLHIGRQALRDALQKTRGFKGISGDIYCRQYGECSSPKIKVVLLDNPASDFESLITNIQYTYTPRKDSK